MSCAIHEGRFLREVPERQHEGGFEDPHPDNLLVNDTQLVFQEEITLK
jgi:hypothetical protein